MNAAILFYFGWLNCGVIFVFIKNVTIFVMSNILKGGESCHNVAGIFMPAISIRRFRTPVMECVMHPQPLRC